MSQKRKPSKTPPPKVFIAKADEPIKSITLDEAMEAGSVSVLGIPNMTPPGWEPVAGIAADSDESMNSLTDLAHRLQYSGEVSGFVRGHQGGVAEGRAEMTEVDSDSLPRDASAQHNGDYTMVDWFGKEYHFALGVQSTAVQALWDEWEKTGLGLHQETIRQAIDTARDSFQFRMDNAFRRHPAFGTMIQSCGDGRYKLAKPTQSSPLIATKGKKKGKKTPKSRQKRV